jgi:hypothetical protein
VAVARRRIACAEDVGSSPAPGLFFSASAAMKKPKLSPALRELALTADAIAYLLGAGLMSYPAHEAPLHGNAGPRVANSRHPRKAKAAAARR